MTSLPARAANKSEGEWADLERLNVEHAAYFLPTVIWLGLLMAIGIPGNTLVIYAYLRYLKYSSSDYFILTLAVFDLVTCVICIPLEIYDLLKPFTFFSDFACKLFRVTQNFTIFGSVVVLVLIAFDRYFKICKPLMFISLFKIKIMCAAAAVIAALFSIPASFVFGIMRTNTHIPSLCGYDCSIAEAYHKSNFVVSYYIGLAVLFIMILVTMGVLYVYVWMEVRKRRQMSKVNVGRPRDQDNVAPNTSAQTSSGNVKARSGSNITTSHAKEVSNLNLSPQQISTNSGSSNSRSWAKQPVSRTTTILFTITLVFILSFLPALTVMVFRVVMTDLKETKNVERLATSEFFLKFYYINNSINPIIYSFLNVNFRHQARLSLGVCKTQRKQKGKLTLSNEADAFNHRRIPKQTQKSSDQADSVKVISSHSQTHPTDHASTPFDHTDSPKAFFSQNLTHASDHTPTPSDHADSLKAVSYHKSTHAPDHTPTPSDQADSPKAIPSLYQSHAPGHTPTPSDHADSEAISSHNLTHTSVHTPTPSCHADSVKTISSHNLTHTSAHTPTPSCHDDFPKAISSHNSTHASDHKPTPSGHADFPKAISSHNSTHAPDHKPTPFEHADSPKAIYSYNPSHAPDHTPIPSGHADSPKAIYSHNPNHAPDHTTTPMEFAESSKAISPHNAICAPEHTHTPTDC